MGLALIALEDGTPMPELFLDPSFVRSGGNGNFILSTSCNGYTPLIGLCGVQVCKDGYGAFYSIEETRIIIAISAFRDSTETNASALVQGNSALIHGHAKTSCSLPSSKYSGDP
uniref:Putative carnitine o-acyltransferase crot n=1 Tax=Ixodes ricinus TaxID=34613 RepID=A0A0K8R531_IXORI